MQSITGNLQEPVHLGDDGSSLDIIWDRIHELSPAVQRSVHSLFEEQAHTRPDKPAICAWDGEMTYKQLDQHSTRLASHLVSLGIGAEQMVPLCFEKSSWAVVAMLAVLKAGGAFVPLDPNHPRTRHEAIFHQTKAMVVLTSAKYLDLWPDSGVRALVVSNASLDQLPCETKICVEVNPRTAVYVMFTSGSTGVLKGVVLEHGAVATSCLAHGKAMHLGSQTRALQFAAYTFDISIAEIITTLIFGGCVCVPSEDDRRSALPKFINDYNVNWAQLTPTVARLLDPETVPSLKVLVLGGERVDDADWRRWSTDLVQVNVQKFLSGTIGGSLASVSWVVDTDDHNKLMPFGEIGKLLVEGPILARGYLNDVSKTEAAFINNPAWLMRGSSSHTGRQGRLYKTGDLVYDADGSLIYVGRKDSQVKVRGQRVELGEIEHHLYQCVPGVLQVAVEVILPTGDQGRSMVAAFLQLSEESRYVTVSQSSDSDSGVQVICAAQLNEQLVQRMPKDMLPEVYFALAAFPQTTSAKADRQQLRTIGASFSAHQLAELRAGGIGPKRQPTTEKEKTLQLLWAQVLGIDVGSIGMDDSFFNLGGDSIAAMKLVVEARRSEIQISVAVVFHNPTLDQLTSAAVDSISSPTATIPRVGRDGPVVQSFAQGRMWFLEELHPGLTWYLMPVVVRIRGPMQLNALQSALNAIESRHETLRTTFETVGDASMQVVLPFQAKEFNIVDIREEDLAEAVHRDQTTSFDLRTEPGWRVSLFRVTEDDCILSIVMHHIVSDGWSTDLLTRELSAFYSAALRGQDPLSHVQPLPIQYRDFSVWQRQQAQVDDHQSQLDYYFKQLNTSRPAELLCDRPRPAVLSGQAGKQVFSIGSALYSQLQQFCKLHGATQFMVLLAAFRATHFRLTGQSDATIGTVDANRDRWELKDMIGFFVNLQDLSRHPLVQLIFAVHSQRNLGHLTLEGVETETLDNAPKSRFDLEFHLFQQDHGPRGEVVYSTDLYTPKTIDNMLSIFQVVLEECLREPTAAVAHLSLLREASLSKLDEMDLLQIQKTAYPREQSVVDLFCQQVSICPNRIAVQDPTTKITYTQLDQVSDVLARWLTKQCLAPETLVGVFAGRSCQTIVAFLGILKANLAYLPLDVKLPAKRMNAIFSSLPGEKIVLVEDEVQPPGMKLCNVRFVRIAELLGEQNNDASASGHIIKPSATSLAYVMFTSGSTGEPKGVMIEHRGIVRLVRDSTFVQHLPASPVMAHMTNLSFDVSTWEIYLSLLQGGTLVCIDRMAVLDPQAVQQRFRREKVRTAFMTPSLFRSYFQQLPPMFFDLELLCVGDRIDCLPPIDATLVVINSVVQYFPSLDYLFKTIRQLLQLKSVSTLFISDIQSFALHQEFLASQAAFIAGDNATKANFSRIIADMERVERELLVDPAFFTALPSRLPDLVDHVEILPKNMKATNELSSYRYAAVIHVKRRHGQKQEQAIQSVGHDEWIDFTARKLDRLSLLKHLQSHSSSSTIAVSNITNSKTAFSRCLVDSLDGTMAETSDLPNWLPSVHQRAKDCPFLSATDLHELTEDVGCRVKISWSRQHSQRGGFDAIFRRYQPCRGENRVLFRFPTDHAERPLHSLGSTPLRQQVLQRTQEQLQNILEAQLPAYMVPQTITFLDSMPTNQSGKVDRSILAERTEIQTAEGKEFQRELTRTELKVQQLMARVLRISANHIGLDDSFFQLGGDSIAAMKLVATARDEDMSLTVTKIFRYPRLVLLAATVQENIHMSHDNIPQFSLLGPKVDPTQTQEEVATICKTSLIHHAIYDGWALAQILNAMQAAYNGAEPEPQLSFKYFIKYLSKIDQDALAAYWQTTLHGCEANIFPQLLSGVQQPIADATAEFQCPLLPKRISNVTTPTLIRAAWAIIASAYTSTDDVVFGATVTGRNAPVVGIESLVGPVIATVPVRIRLLRDSTVLEYLKTVQKQATNMILYEQTGLQQIAKLAPDTKHACSFQKLLIVQPSEDAFQTDNTFGTWEFSSGIQDFTTYALMVQCKLSENSIKITASFDARLIQQWQVEKMLGQLSFVMQQLARQDVNTRVRDVELLTPSDLQQLWSWNHRIPPTIKRCVHDLYLENVRSQPNADSVCAWDGEMTYKELDEQSSRLADHLVDLDVRPESIVPLCFKKSMWMVVAVLAVLKAGGAFAPFEPDHPISRHQEIFKQTKAKIVLTSAQYATLWSDCTPQIVAISGDFMDRLPSRSYHALVSTRPDNAAYVIFTSGSTGVPKGVRVDHKAISTSCMSLGAAFGITKDTRAFQFSAHTFDVFVAEVVITLVQGGCVCIPSDTQRRDNLIDTMNKMRVTWTLLTPAVARILDPKKVLTLKTLALGGEKVNASDCEPWLGHVQLVNAYGPAECCITCVSNPDLKGTDPEPIGKSVTSVGWVTDPTDHNRLAPLGAVGELLVEGPNLARDYLNDSAKTGSSFINDPPWLLKGSEVGSQQRGTGKYLGRQGRLYKTGDLVYYAEDGSLLFVGRKDGQIKVRGQRVELGEIEHNLYSCMPNIKTIAVEMISLTGGSPIIAAFLEASPGILNGEASELRPGVHIVFSTRVEGELSQRLPKSMLPGIYLALEEFPMTTSSKIDRKRLREIGGAFSAQQIAKLRTQRGNGAKQQPKTEQEETLQKLWSQVLGIEATSIGLDDSFFQLGGDSIAAMKLVNEARTIGMRLSVQDIFQAQRLCDLSSLLNQFSTASESVITKVDHHGPIAQSFAQGRLWFLEQLYPGLDWYLMHIAVHIRGPLQLHKLEAALRMVERRHETLRTTFSTSNGEGQQEVHACRDGKLLNLIEIGSEDDEFLLKTLERIVDVFCEQAAMQPARIAVKDSLMELTYAQLDEQLEKLAKLLAIVAFLGILKAGLAYLLFNPNALEKRMESILLTMEGKKLIIVGLNVQLLSVRLDDIKFAHIAAMLDVDKAKLSRAKLDPALRPQATSLAYILFTSSSTGQLKGVMVEHYTKSPKTIGHLDTLLVAEDRANPDNLFAAQSLLISHVTLEEVLEERNSNIDNNNQGHLEQLGKTSSDRPQCTTINGVKTLFFGDIYSHALHQEFFAIRALCIAGKRASKADLLYIIEDIDTHAVAISNIPYSKAILGRCLLDSLEDKKARKPVNVNWTTLINQKARQIPSLSAVELGEMAKEAGCHVQISWNRQHSQRGGMDAVFYSRQLNNDRSNAGPVFSFPTDHTGRPQQTFTNKPLQQEFIKQVQLQLVELVKLQLPSYMVPQSVQVLDKLPINQNGKVDRKTLAQRTKTHTAVGQETLQRELSPAEVKLQMILARVLGIDASRIRLEDRFFQLGGDSIAAMKIVGAAREEGIQLTVANIFQRPKLVDLATVAQFSHQIAEESPIQPFHFLSPAQRDSLLQAIPANTANVNSNDVVDILPTTWIQKLFVSRGVRNQPLAFNYFFFDLRPRVDVPRLKSSVAALVQHFSILRTMFVYVDGVLWQTILRKPLVQLAEFHLDTSLDEAADSVCLQNSRTTHPLELPTAFLLICGAANQHRLAFRISHAQYDGVCFPLFIKTLFALYSGKSVEPSHSYSAYLAYNQGIKPASARYWHNLLQGARITRLTPLLSPTIQHDRTPIEIQTDRITSMPKVPIGLTLASLISSAWAHVLAHITGEEDIVYGYMVAGRNANLPTISKIVGPCVNIIPVRARIHQTTSPLAIVRSIQEQYIALGEADSMGLDEIARTSTD
ncbi:hypothetical protein OPT61_g5221 [Boeremia exigua]|uniref:Uncharacterized protein n=1 Tax=Boeremia exigua TaxID=749465 RepID=A0ACC2IB79_9PLEO|nr:hypothetical protein OPT61_g5221 [Boeremia exigua]